MKVYIASSWRNKERVRAFAQALRKAGHEPFDFTSRVDSVPRDSLPEFVDQPYRRHMEDIGPLLKHQIDADIAEISRCDVLVLLLPCGSDAHFELGMAYAFNLDTVVVGQPAPDQRVGMHLLATKILDTDNSVISYLNYLEGP